MTHSFGKKLILIEEGFELHTTYNSKNYSRTLSLLTLYIISPGDAM